MEINIVDADDLRVMTTRIRNAVDCIGGANEEKAAKKLDAIAATINNFAGNELSNDECVTLVKYITLIVNT